MEPVEDHSVTESVVCMEKTDLLDDMLDNDFPLTTEPNNLQEIAAPPNM